MSRPSFLARGVIGPAAAVTEAGLGLVERWLSARIGEDLILDLRTAVFDHVQRMPVAFFTRTRTGALVSRLNNDVIGAQRAFSDTLSGVVSNCVMLLLTFVVMIGISWQITLLALLLLPLFVLPARRMGTRLALLEREAANHNAAMSTQMTERFSAPGATLVAPRNSTPGGCPTDRRRWSSTPCASATRRRRRCRSRRWRRSRPSTPAAAWRCCTTCRSGPSPERWWRWSARRYRTQFDQPAAVAAA